MQIIRLGAAGPDVRAIQAALNQRARQRGLRTVKVDGEYGPRTDKAARTVARALGARESTIAKPGLSVGEQRIIRWPSSRTPAQYARAASRARAAKARRAAAARAQGSRGKAIAWAANKIGIRESPAGSNGNPKNISMWQQSLGFGRVPWCGIFCAKALQHAGVHGVSSRLAGVALIEEDAKARRAPFRGWTFGRDGVNRGDLVVIGGYGVHVELVERVLSNGAIQTIGGNTSPGSSGSQANGGGVFRRVRGRGEIRGIAHVNYPNH